MKEELERRLFTIASQTGVGEVFEYIDCINAFSFENFHVLDRSKCLVEYRPRNFVVVKNICGEILTL